MIAVGALIVFRPYPVPDRSRVEPRLLALREPYRKVEAASYLDGGSVGVRITDAEGRVEEFAIPNRFDKADDYRRVFVGALHADRPGAVEVAHGLATKHAIVLVLFRYSHGDPEVDFARAVLSRRATDFVKVLVHRLGGGLKNR